MPKGVSASNQRAGVSLTERLTYYSDRSAGECGCWIWKGARAAKRYGSLHWRGRIEKAHRLAWEDANSSSVPAGMVVCHRCDVPLCVNPAHLFIGTQSENIADMMAKARNRHLAGERHQNAKLTAETVAIIRASGETSGALGTRFGINPATVRRIIRREAWKHV